MTRRLITLSRKRNLLGRYYISQEVTRRLKRLGLGHEQEGEQRSQNPCQGHTTEPELVTQWGPLPLPTLDLGDTTELPEGT